MKMLRTLSTSHVLFIVALVSAPASIGAQTQLNNEQESFFEALKALCQQSYSGEMTFPIEGQDSFAGKELVAHFESCSESQIRIPFSVGEDTSRTWLITKTEFGLQLKHDHRHKDGSEHEINRYGGTAVNGGSSSSQSFAADKHTATIIPAASTNVWTLSLSDDAQTLTYHLERNAAPRFTAELFRN